VIEADRYRKLTKTLQEIIKRGGEIIEIAGNDDILVTAIRTGNSNVDNVSNAKIIADIPRDGYDDHRLLLNSKVTGLARLFAELEAKGILLEHVYDY